MIADIKKMVKLSQMNNEDEDEFTQNVYELILQLNKYKYLKKYK